MSRPEIPLDWDRVDELLLCGCLGTEVAAHFNMHPETFYNRVQQKFGIGYTEYASKKKAKGESLLREAQYKKALGLSKKGDNTLLIWLGKQRLNQKESPLEFAANGELDKKFDSMMEQIKSLQVPSSSQSDLSLVSIESSEE